MPFTMTRAFLRKAACCLAGVLLSAQMAIAAYACPGVVAAITGEPQQASASAPTMPDCAGMEAASGAALDPAAPNLCAEHCKYGQQSDNPGTMSLPVPVLALLYAAPPSAAHSPPPRPSAASLSALVAASPPHAIAHCVYRI
jgi:hypothetical protein